MRLPLGAFDLIEEDGEDVGDGSLDAFQAGRIADVAPIAKDTRP